MKAILRITTGRYVVIKNKEYKITQKSFQILRKYNLIDEIKYEV